MSCGLCDDRLSGGLCSTIILNSIFEILGWPLKGLFCLVGSGSSSGDGSILCPSAMGLLYPS